MLKALRLDDDLDPVGVVIAIEETFDIKIGDVEAENIFTVGEMYDLLRKKVHWSDANRKCASAMAFYRIRRALNDLGIEIGRSPSSSLLPLHVYTKPFVKNLESKSGLRLPRPASGPLGKAGMKLLVTAVLGSLALFIASFIVSKFLIFFPAELISTLPAVAVVLLFAGVAAGVTLLKKDAGRLPETYSTLGALAKRVANMNYGRLVKQGAAASDDRIWEVLVNIISDFSGDPADQIARETYFLKSVLKKRGAAA